MKSVLGGGSLQDMSSGMVNNLLTNLVGKGGKGKGQRGGNLFLQQALAGDLIKSVLGGGSLQNMSSDILTNLVGKGGQKGAMFLSGLLSLPAKLISQIGLGTRRKCRKRLGVRSRRYKKKNTQRGGRLPSYLDCKPWDPPIPFLPGQQIGTGSKRRGNNGHCFEGLP